ncbi:MAG TPA: ADOP family duplicated permease [Acidobacteriota bacterium]|nr:ADOP family duplicated permease [Acidobacteriota bacterium]
MRVRLKHERLARIIASSKMTQNRWALRLGLSSGQLSELVNGKRPYPPPATRRKLLRKLDLEFEELFEIEWNRESGSRPALIDLKTLGYRLRLEKVPPIQDKRGHPMRDLLFELRYTLRALRRSPVFAAAAILTLALAIAANAAMFTVFDAALLQPLPYPEADELAYLSIGVDGRSGYPLALSDWEAMRDAELKAFDEIALYFPGQATLHGLQEPQRVDVGHVSPNFFRTLGVSPAQGSGFSGQPHQVIVSDNLWRQLEGGEGGDSPFSPMSLSLDEKSYQVVGVLPPGFSFPGLPGFRIWSSMEMRPSGARGPFQYRGVVRLAPEVSQAKALEDLERAHALVAERFSENDSRTRYALTDLQEHFVGSSRSTLILLLAAVGAVLLIAAVNVACLALTRAAGRAQEIAIRSALGAGRYRLLRLFLSEGLAISLSAGILGCFLSFWMADLLSAAYPARLEPVRDIAVGGRTLLFALGASLICGILISMAPTLQTLQSRLIQRLRSAGRDTAGRFQSRMGNALVTFEFALALTLLVGAGLLSKSLFLLVQQDPGFRPERVVTMSLSLPSSRYGDTSQRSAFFERLLQDVKALPTVTAAGLASGLPPDRPGITSDFYFEGRPLASGERPPIEVLIFADNGYFDSLEIPLKRGSWFERRGPESVPQVLIDEELAGKYFPSQSPIGKRLRIGSNPQSPWVEIRGVVGRAKYAGLPADFKPTLYVSAGVYALPSMHLVVRSAQDPAGLAAAVRQRLSEMDSTLALASIRPLGQILRDSASPQRFRAMLMLAFAGTALLLAMIGIFAVISFTVRRRTRETGIRMALGATRADVLQLMLRKGMYPALAGLAIGLAASAAAARLLSSMLYRVGTWDVATFGASVAAVLAAALAACLIPAKRATRVDPVQSLRSE